MEKLTFTPTQEDLKNAYNLHIKRVSWKRFPLLVAIGVLIGLILSAIDGFSDPEEATILIISMALWALIVGLAIRFLIPLLWIPRMAKKIHAQQKDMRLETQTWWDEEKFYSANEQGHAHIKFADMVKWRSNDQVILLYRSDHLFNFLPARVFPDNALRDGLIRRLNDAGVEGASVNRSI